MDYENKIKELEEELIKTKEELIETKERLKKYTAPARSKTFYENHKEEIIQKVKDYKKIQTTRIMHHLNKKKCGQEQHI